MVQGEVEVVERHCSDDVGRLVMAYLLRQLSRRQERHVEHEIDARRSGSIDLGGGDRLSWEVTRRSDVVRLSFRVREVTRERALACAARA